MGRSQLSNLLQQTDFEVIPLKGTIDKVSALPSGSSVTVTASPSKGMKATIDLALQLQDLGYRAVPHLSARSVKSRQDLASIIKRLDAGGVTQAFVTGGDGEPAGDYFDAGSLLRDMADLGHPFLDVGITGYPEGHPVISDHLLLEALLDKQGFATYAVTQMCFNATTIVDWITRIRDHGVRIPIKVGIPGAVHPTRLLTMSAKIGVGDSMRFVAKNRGVFRLLRPGAYHPDRLIKSMAAKAETHAIVGIHLFTFNQLESTAEWHRRLLARQD